MWYIILKQLKLRDIFTLLFALFLKYICLGALLYYIAIEIVHSSVMWCFRKYSNLHNQYFTAFSIYIIILISKNLFSFEEQLVCSEKRYFECIGVVLCTKWTQFFCKKDTTKFLTFSHIHRQTHIYLVARV